MSKRILHKFRMNEISGVDRMAQEGAKMMIMKRDDSIAKGAFKDALFVMEVEGVLNEAYWAMWDSDEAMRQAIYNITENSTKYPNTQAAIIEAMGEYSEKVQEQVAEAAAAVPIEGDDSSSPNDPTNKSDHSDDSDKNNQLDPEEDDPMSKKAEPTVETLTVELEGVNEQLAKSEAFGKLNDAERAHYSSLDEANQAEFMKMDDGDRKNIIEKNVADDSVVYTAVDGEEFRKSDDPRLVKMAKDRDDDRKLAKAEREKRENLELTKRASDELENLPGEIDAKVALLKAVEGIDEAHRDKITSLLKAGNDAMSKSFETVGTQSVPTGGPADKLNALAKKHATDNNVNFHKAYDEVLKTDEGEALYNETQKP